LRALREGRVQLVQERIQHLIERAAISTQNPQSQRPGIGPALEAAARARQVLADLRRERAAVRILKSLERLVLLLRPISHLIDVRLRIRIEPLFVGLPVL
jgi:hypothetical protein